MFKDTNFNSAGVLTNYTIISIVVKPDLDPDYSKKNVLCKHISMNEMNAA